MGLEELVKELRHSAAEEEKRVLASAHESAKEVLTQAVNESNAIVEAAKVEGAALAVDEARKVSSARLKAKRVMAEERERVIQAAMGRLQKRLAELASAKAGEKRKLYEKLFNKLAKNAVAELGGDAVIYCRKEDLSMAAKFGKTKALDCTGGMVAQDAGGRVRASYTFESLLEQYAVELKRVAYGELFGERRKQQVIAQSKAKAAKAVKKPAAAKTLKTTPAKAKAGKAKKPAKGSKRRANG
jgi:vacuolar-type H+-ATPase subunit E/Vma4